MKKALLLGGTGAMGVYLSDIFAEMGYDVVVTTRQQRAKASVGRYVTGDAHDMRFVRQLLADEHPDVIVDFMVYSSMEFAQRRDILLSGAWHYMFLSSYRVFADSVPITERSPRLLDVIRDEEYLRTDEYALAKAREEDLLRESDRRNWTILRPCITYSKSRFQFGCLEANIVCYRALRGLPVVIPGEMLDKRTTLSWGRDVALMISRLALNEAAFGEDFNVVSGESHTWRDVAEIYRDAIGMQVREVTISQYCQFCGREQVLYDRMYDRVMDNTKVLATTGLRQSDMTPLSVGLRRELECFKDSPHYTSINVEANALIDRMCNTRMSLSGMRISDRLRYCARRYPSVGAIVRCAKIPQRIVRKFT